MILIKREINLSVYYLFINQILFIRAISHHREEGKQLQHTRKSISVGAVGVRWAERSKHVFSFIRATQ